MFPVQLLFLCVISKNILCCSKFCYGKWKKSKVVLAGLCPSGFIADVSEEICYNFSTVAANASVAELYCQQLYNESTLPVFRTDTEYLNFINHPKYKF